MSDNNELNTLLGELEDRRKGAQVERVTREIGAELEELGERARLAKHNPYEVARGILAGEEVEPDGLKRLAMDYIALLSEQMGRGER